MTNLSVNLNKVALLRNARNFGRPSVIEAALTCIKAGAQGITVHPRPDQRHIKRVCCLLPNQQLASYSNLLDTYKQEFGNQLVCWAPIADFHLYDLETLTQQILPFLIEADKENEKVVVHCSGGIGRTGHMLAAWLVSGR